EQRTWVDAGDAPAARLHGQGQGVLLGLRRVAVGEFTNGGQDLNAAAVRWGLLVGVDRAGGEQPSQQDALAGVDRGDSRSSGDVAFQPANRGQIAVQESRHRVGQRVSDGSVAAL